MGSIPFSFASFVFTLLTTFVMLYLSFFVKDDPVDFNDPAFLSTTNPHWVEAGLSQGVIDALSSKGIVRFTPVQAEAFGPVMARRDVIGRSRTGTGKTCKLCDED